MTRTIRGRPRGRGGSLTRVGPSSSRQPIRLPSRTGCTLGDDSSSSDDSTQPQDFVLKTEFPEIGVETADKPTGRATWIIKHHADMSYAKWNDMLDNEKKGAM